MTDADLLRRAQSGDCAAWQTLYARCLPGVWRYAYTLCRDHHLAEEAVSETMVALVRGIEGLDPATCHLHGWLRCVVRNKLSDMGRRAVRQRRLIESVSGEPLRHGAEDDPSGPLEIDETRARVLNVLNQLDEMQRQSLEYKYLDKLSVREIADCFGHTEKAAESLLYRARREFRRLYDLAERRELHEPIGRTSDV